MEWVSKRINPSIINGGQQYSDGNDFPSILDLNDTIQGQLYSNDLSEQSKAIADGMVTRQTAFENTINTKQTAFETKITTQQTAFETKITTQQTTFEGAINSKQAAFETKITNQQDEFEDYITERQDKTEEVANEALIIAKSTIDVSNQAKDISQRAFEKANTAEFNSIEARSVAFQANDKASDVERRANEGEFNGQDGANGVIINKDIFLGFEQDNSYIQGVYTITPINVVGGIGMTFTTTYQEAGEYTLNIVNVAFGG